MNPIRNSITRGRFRIVVNIVFTLFIKTKNCFDSGLNQNFDVDNSDWPLQNIY